MSLVLTLLNRGSQETWNTFFFWSGPAIKSSCLKPFILLHLIKSNPETEIEILMRKCHESGLSAFICSCHNTHLISCYVASANFGTEINNICIGSNMHCDSAWFDKSHCTRQNIRFWWENAMNLEWLHLSVQDINQI